VQGGGAARPATWLGAIRSSRRATASPRRRHEHLRARPPAAPVGAVHARRERPGAGEGQDHPADAIIFDLEDAVAPDAKPDARSKAVAAASSGEYGNRELTIRCNGLDTQWGAADIAAAATSGAAAVVIPKVSSVGGLDQVSALLDSSGARAEMMIWAMIETPTAVFDVRAIAAHPRVNCS
jgi:citrate lyase beta subunit